VCLEQLRDRADLPAAAAELIRTGAEQERVVALLGLRQAASRGREAAEAAALAVADAAPRVRIVAVRTLGVISWPGSRSVLEILTQDGDLDVRKHALLGLLEIDAASGLRRIGEMIDGAGNDDATLGVALSALEDARPDEVPPSLVRLGHHADAEVRRRAIAILGYSSSTAVEPLYSALHDSSSQVRLAAIAAMMRRREPPPAASLSALLSDPDPSVRQLTLPLIVYARGPRDPALLDQLPTDSLISVAEAAAVLGGAVAIPRIHTMIARSASPADEIAAWRAVGLVGQAMQNAGAAFLELLRRALRSGDDRVRRAALQAAPSLGATGAGLVAEQAANELEPLVRAVAIASLARILGSAARPQLCVALEDPSEVVRRSAMEALGRVGRAADRLAIERVRAASPLEDMMRWQAVARLAPGEAALSEATRDLADPGHNGRLFTQWYAPSEDLRAVFSRAGAVIVVRDGDDVGESESCALLDDGRVRIGDRVCLVQLRRARIHEPVVSVWGYRCDLTPDPWSDLPVRVLETTAWSADGAAVT
jgi:HEAT repeat protein